MIHVFNIDEEGRFGGPERRISLVAEELQQMGVATTVVIPKLDSSYFKRYLEGKNIKYVTLDITRLSLEPKILFRFIYRFPLEVFLLVATFLRYKPDVVHVNGASQFKVALSARLARRLIVWHLNNTYLKRPVKIVFDILSRFCADGIIYAGSKAGEFYRVKEKFACFPSANIEAPVSDQFFLVPIKSNIGNRLEIVSIGGVNAAKGITDIVRCAAECRKRGINFRIRIAGKILASQKSYFKEIQQLIKNYNIPPETLVFLGEVEDIPSLLAGADIALTLSHREASPMAVWEGLAAGRVVLTTDVGSVRDHIEHGKNGFIVPPQDVNAAVEIIEAIAKKKISLNGMREAARATAKKHFSVLTIAKQHKEIYIKILNNRKYQ